MIISEYIAIGTFGLGIASVTIGTTWKISQDLKKSLDEINTKRARIYERIDEEKVKSDNKYTNKEICELRHKQVEDTLKEVRDDVKHLLMIVKNGNK